MKIKKPKFWDHKGLSFFPVILFPFSLVYYIAHLTNFFFKKPKKFGIPVICVGNIYLGGTGKTPLALKTAFNFSLSGPEGIKKPLPINCFEWKHKTEKSGFIEKS